MCFASRCNVPECSTSAVIRFGSLLNTHFQDLFGTVWQEQSPGCLKQASHTSTGHLLQTVSILHLQESRSEQSTGSIKLAESPAKHHMVASIRVPGGIYDFDVGPAFSWSELLVCSVRISTYSLWGCCISYVEGARQHLSKALNTYLCCLQTGHIGNLHLSCASHSPEFWNSLKHCILPRIHHSF